MTGLKLQDNTYNRSLRPDAPKFKLWNSAGLMLTYSCPSRCACCYIFCGPDAGDEKTEMTAETAIACWESVRRLAGSRGKVHLTGGEPFINYQRLKTILQKAQSLKLDGLEKIETNAFWCTDENLVRSRLAELKELGLTKLQISCDIYHQQYVPIERVRLACRIAREVLGPDKIQIRWQDFLKNPIKTESLNPDERSVAFKATLHRRSERMLGRAAVELSHLLSLKDHRHINGNCKKSFLGARHVHIDGMGNVFSGTCVGIIIGRIGPSGQAGLEEIWKNFHYQNHPIFSILVARGPLGLMDIAMPFGYRPQKAYASQCHFCYDIRHFLYQTGRYSRYLGPGVCYGGCEKIR